MALATDLELVDQWRDIQAVYFRTSAALDRKLTAEFNIGLNEFEILDLVVESAKASCRMKDLGERTPMTQSAVSKVVDRLEKAGLLTRRCCTEDRRSLYLDVTKAGRKLHEAAAVEHRALLSENLD